MSSVSASLHQVPHEMLSLLLLMQLSAVLYLCLSLSPYGASHSTELAQGTQHSTASNGAVRLTPLFTPTSSYRHSNIIISSLRHHHTSSRMRSSANIFARG